MIWWLWHPEIEVPNRCASPKSRSEIRLLGNLILNRKLGCRNLGLDRYPRRGPELDLMTEIEVPNWTRPKSRSWNVSRIRLKTARVKSASAKTRLQTGLPRWGLKPTSTLWLAQLESAFSSSVSVVKLAGCLAQFSQSVRLAHVSSPVWLAHFSCLVWLAHFSLLVWSVLCCNLTSMWGLWNNHNQSHVPQCSHPPSCSQNGNARSHELDKNKKFVYMLSFSLTVISSFHWFLGHYYLE